MPRPHAHAQVLLLSLLGATSMSALAVLSTPSVAQGIDKGALYPALVLLMALSGISTVGFIGMALNLTVALGAPVSEVYTVGAIEWLIQGLGGGLSTASAVCSVGFNACVAVAWFATLMLAAARFWSRA